MMNRKFVFFLLILALAVSVCGCSILPGTLEDSLEDVWTALPETPENAYDAPVGDMTESDISRVTLYYPSADRSLLMPVTRLFWMNGAQTAEERVAEEMIKSPVGPDIVSIVPADARLAWAEKSMGTLTLNLITAKTPENDAETAAMLAALTATFTEMGSAEYVNVLLNGKALSVCGLPAGALSGISVQPGRWLRSLSEEAERFMEEGNETKPERHITVYCPAQEGELVVPEVRTIVLSDSNGVQAALSELKNAPYTATLLNGIPSIENVFEKDAEITESDGRRTIDVHYSPAAFDALEESAVTRWQFLASQVLTLTSFVPDIDGVRVYFGEYPVTEAPDSTGRMIAFADGILTRGDFAGTVGTLAKVYFADENDRLTAVTRAVSCADAESMRALIALIMQGPGTDELRATLPDGLTPADILGTVVRDHVAEVNLSAEFYRRCQKLDAREEMLAVFSIVNTLTSDHFAPAVRFYIEGKSVDTLAGNIALGGALIEKIGG